MTGLRDQGSSLPLGIPYQRPFCEGFSMQSSVGSFRSSGPPFRRSTAMESSHSAAVDHWQIFNAPRVFAILLAGGSNS